QHPITAEDIMRLVPHVVDPNADILPVGGTGTTAGANEPAGAQITQAQANASLDDFEALMKSGGGLTDEQKAKGITPEKAAADLAEARKRVAAGNQDDLN